MSSNSDNMLETILKDLGFNDKEQLVLSCLLSNPPMPASLIAKRTKLKRPTAYLIIEQLIELGLVIRQTKGSVSYFTSVNPNLIASVIESRAENKYSNVVESTKKFREYLKNSKDSELDLSGFKIEVLKSYDSIYDQLTSVLVGGDFDGIFNPQKVFYSNSEKRIIKKFLEHTASSQARIREIIVDGDEAKWYKSVITNKNHQIKILPEGEKILSDLIITKKFVIISHYEEPDAVAIKIKHSEFLTTQKAIFELLWARI